MTNHMAGRLPFSMTGPTGSCHHDNQVAHKSRGAFDAQRPCADNTVEDVSAAP